MEITIGFDHPDHLFTEEQMNGILKEAIELFNSGDLPQNTWPEALRAYLEQSGVGKPPFRFTVRIKTLDAW